MTRYILAAMVLLSGCAEQAGPKTPVAGCQVWENGACIDDQVGDYDTALDGDCRLTHDCKVAHAARWEMWSQESNEENPRLVAVCRDHADCSNRVEMANLEQAEIGGSLVFYVSGDKTP